MSTHRIAVIPGDGIGQEVIPAALRVLEAVASRSDSTSISWSSHTGAPITRRTGA